MFCDEKEFLFNILTHEFNVSEESLMDNHSETINHMLRCGKNARKFGAFLQLNKDEIELLTKCAVIHDIGKVSIKPELLYKKELNNQEFSEIKDHVFYKYKKEHNFEPAIEDTIACHHCAPNGGYGDLKGRTYEEIHDFAKITTLIDVYDVLTHKRVYKDWIMDIDNVYLEIENNIDNQFDRNFANKFISFLKCNHK